MFDKWWHIPIAVLWVAVGLLFGIWRTRLEAKRRGVSRPVFVAAVIAHAPFGPLPILVIIWAAITDLFRPY